MYNAKKANKLVCLLQYMYNINIEIARTHSPLRADDAVVRDSLFNFIQPPADDHITLCSYASMYHS